MEHRCGYSETDAFITIPCSLLPCHHLRAASARQAASSQLSLRGFQRGPGCWRGGEGILSPGYRM